MFNFTNIFESEIEKEKKIDIPAFFNFTLPITQKEKEIIKQVSKSNDISWVSRNVLETADFDTTFKWPKKLPEGFNPEELIEGCKNPGLGIDELHKSGITGKGITVAIIDQTISPKHKEFKNNLIKNKEYSDGKPKIIMGKISMHGPAVASLLVGKKCGVAPDAKLYYAGHGGETNSFLSFTKALKDIIEYNKTHEDKIKIVSVSKGYQEIPGVKEWLELKKEAKNLGITVIDCDYFNENNIHGGGSIINKDKPDDYELPLFYPNSQRNIPSIEDLKHKLSLTDEYTRKNFFDKYKTEQNYINTIKESLIVPSDYRTMASMKGNDEYVYNAKGGWSWAVPYYAGVFALALQVNPDLTNEKFLEIVKRTAGKTKKGFKVINPPGIIEEVKKTVEKEK